MPRTPSNECFRSSVRKGLDMVLDHIRHVVTVSPDEKLFKQLDKFTFLKNSFRDQG